jgi:hypothetical protein
MDLNSIKRAFVKKLFSYRNRCYLASKPENLYLEYSYGYLRERFDARRREGRKLILATQVGRGGGKWVCDIINQHSNATAYGERNRLLESLFRYSTSYRLEFDYTNFFRAIMSEALSDWEFTEISYISSPYFSHGLALLREEIEPDSLIILLNEKFRAATSFYNKNWYLKDQEVARSKGRAPFFDQAYNETPSHFFGRNIYFDEDEAQLFSRSSRLGKIGVFLDATLNAITRGTLVANFKDVSLIYLPTADQNYDFYLRLNKQFRFTSILTEGSFLRLKGRTSTPIENSPLSLPQKDINEFLAACKNWDANIRLLGNRFNWLSRPPFWGKQIF